MNPIRILYVSTATDFFLKQPPLSTHVQSLSEHIADLENYDARELLVGFGVINERKNNIHEMNRLSGVNVRLGKECYSLVVKVPSLRNMKLPTYFVHNEELFQRKGVFTDADGNLYPDNDLRSIFFCKSVLHIIEHLAWIPHIIHCHGWFTSFLPLLVKKGYGNSAFFQHTKVISTLYEEHPTDQIFSSDIEKNLRHKQLKSDEIAAIFPKPVDHAARTQVAMDYSDVTTRTFAHTQDPSGISYEKSTYIPAEESSHVIYQALYDELYKKILNQNQK